MSITRLFGDPILTPDNFSSFSKQEIAADTAIKALEQLQAIPPVRSTTPMDLANVLGATAVGNIQNAGQITFHTVGDTGGVHSPQFQFAVADAMTTDLASGAAFFYHLGDVVYYFGQEQYYFEQFYDPYRNYNAPIFAIPGNHDAVTFKSEAANSLDAFIANFCAPQPAPTSDSQGAVRTTMDQPGVFFTLNAPFVKFIGLYSNTSEGASQGVISGTNVGNAQLTFLQQQLAAAKAERAAGNWRALILATHHPPFTGSPRHVPSPEMLSQIDQACTAAGIFPDMHLSGHSHLYERYTRTIGGKQIPYLVAGMGGFYDLLGLKPNATPPPQTPQSGTDAGNHPLTLNTFLDKSFGFLRITVSPAVLTGQFVTVDPTSGATGSGDSFTLNFQTGVVSNGLPAAKAAPKPKPKGKGKAAPKRSPAPKKRR